MCQKYPAKRFRTVKRVHAVSPRGSGGNATNRTSPVIMALGPVSASTGGGAARCGAEQAKIAIDRSGYRMTYRVGRRLRIAHKLRGAAAAIKIDPSLSSGRRATPASCAG